MGDWYPEEFPDDETTTLAVREVDKENQPSAAKTSKPLSLKIVYSQVSSGIGRDMYFDCKNNFL